MSLALLFPGQGVQHEAMLPWLDGDAAAAPVLAQMAAAIGPDWRARLVDADWSQGNRVAQCLMTGTSLAAFHALRHAGLPAPSTVAGYSVGELAAFSAAGVFDAATALALAETRADAMDRSAAGRSGGLLSVSGLLPAAIDAACARWSLEVAIRIAPDRCLLGGDTMALDAASAELMQQGAELMRLRIRVASHTSQMREAAEAFAAAIEQQPWQVPNALLIANLDGDAVRRVPELKRCLAQQIAHPVQWQRCLETLAERRPRCVLEVGAGNSLSKLWLAAQPDIPSRSADEFGSAASVVAWVAACLRD